MKFLLLLLTLAVPPHVEHPVTLDLNVELTSFAAAAKTPETSGRARSNEVTSPAAATSTAAPYTWEDAFRIEREATLKWKQVALRRGARIEALESELAETRDRLFARTASLAAELAIPSESVCPVSPWVTGALGCALCLGGAAIAISARPP